MIFVVEVLAIYEDPGVSPTQQRINQRDADFAEANQASAAVNHYTVAGQEAPEYMVSFGRVGDDEPSSRYGFGWRARSYIVVRQDSDNVGRAIWNRLTTRGLRNGSKTEVFEHRADEGNPFLTGELLFGRYLPPGRDVG